MKVELLKVNVAKNTKTDRNGKKFKTVGIESPELQFVYFYNAYTQNDPVLFWKKGDRVDIEITDSGEWHNFKPITAYKPSSQVQPSPRNADRMPVSAPIPPETDTDAHFRQVEAEIAGLRKRVDSIEGELNDLRNEGKIDLK